MFILFEDQFWNTSIFQNNEGTSTQAFFSCPIGGIFRNERAFLRGNGSHGKKVQKKGSGAGLNPGPLRVETNDLPLDQSSDGRGGLIAGLIPAVTNVFEVQPVFDVDSVFGA